jgi:hypothetical protein
MISNHVFELANAEIKQNGDERQIDHYAYPGGEPEEAGAGWFPACFVTIVFHDIWYAKSGGSGSKYKLRDFLLTYNF